MPSRNQTITLSASPVAQKRTNRYASAATLLDAWNSFRLHLGMRRQRCTNGAEDEPRTHRQPPIPE
jgi:hypothetical protein